MEYFTTVFYRIEGKQDDLQKIFAQYQTLLSKKQSEKGDDKYVSESNLVNSLGIDCKRPILRGNIIRGEFVGISLSIETEEDWVMADFRYPLERHYDGMKIYYMVESYKDETYATNDVEGKYFPTRVRVDYHLAEPIMAGYERFNSMKEALDYFARILKCDTLTIEDIDKWNNEHSWKDGFIYFNKFEVDQQ